MDIREASILSLWPRSPIPGFFCNEPYYNEHICWHEMVEISSGARDGQCSKGRGCSKAHVYQPLPRLNHITGFNTLCTQFYAMVSCCTLQSPILNTFPLHSNNQRLHKLLGSCLVEGVLFFSVVIIYWNVGLGTT